MALRSLLLCLALTSVDARSPLSPPPECNAIKEKNTQETQSEALKLQKSADFETIRKCLSSKGEEVVHKCGVEDMNGWKPMCANPACLAARRATVLHECIPASYPIHSEFEDCVKKHFCEDDMSTTAVMAMASLPVMDAIFQASPDSSNGNFMTILGGVAGAVAGAALTTIVVRRRSVRQPALLA